MLNSTVNYMCKRVLLLLLLESFPKPHHLRVKLRRRVGVQQGQLTRLQLTCHITFPSSHCYHYLEVSKLYSDQ